MFWLELVGPDGKSSRVPIGERPLFLGRDPTNDVALTDDTVSNRHASLFVRDGRVWLEDLKSTNGTKVNGKRVADPVELKPGDDIELGRRTRLSLVGDAMARDERLVVPVLEHVDVGAQVPITTDRLEIGPRPGSAVRLDVPEEEAATLLVYPTGEIWLGRHDELTELSEDGRFEIAGHTFRVRRPASVRQATRDIKAVGSPYAVRVTLDGPLGPEAVVEDLDSGRTHKVDAENRATLLYVLAAKARDELSAGIPADIAGWCTDDEVVVGVWGRAAVDNPVNSLHVLVSRLRKELRSAGIDPWLIEKRRGHIRVRVREARVGA
jgi:hypothetical protein